MIYYYYLKFQYTYYFCSSVTLEKLDKSNYLRSKKYLLCEKCTTIFFHYIKLLKYSVN